MLNVGARDLILTESISSGASHLFRFVGFPTCLLEPFVGKPATRQTVSCCSQSFYEQEQNAEYRLFPCIAIVAVLDLKGHGCVTVIKSH